MNKWHKRYLDMAKLVASWSKDPRKKVGAIIVDQDNRVVSTGYNGFPRCIEDKPEDYRNKKLKLEKIIHAEVNAILSARANLKGYTLYCYPLMPCARCATVILQAGITTVVFPYKEDKKTASSWDVSHDIAISMFQEARIELVLI